MPDAELRALSVHNVFYHNQSSWASCIFKVHEGLMLFSTLDISIIKLRKNFKWLNESIILVKWINCSCDPKNKFQQDLILKGHFILGPMHTKWFLSRHLRAEAYTCFNLNTKLEETIKTPEFCWGFWNSKPLSTMQCVVTWAESQVFTCSRVSNKVFTTEPIIPLWGSFRLEGGGGGYNPFCHNKKKRKYQRDTKLPL